MKRPTTRNIACEATVGVPYSFENGSRRKELGFRNDNLASWLNIKRRCRSSFKLTRMVVNHTRRSSFARLTCEIEVTMITTDEYNCRTSHLREVED